MIAFSQENVKQVKAEIADLLVQHWNETGRHKDRFKLDPDWMSYEAAEKFGVLRVYTVREDSVLVGYAVYVVHNAMHYFGTKYADNDVFFILPEARKGLMAARFFGYIEEQLKKEKVDLIINKVKEQHSEAMGAFFSRLGYKKTEIVYTKLVS